MRLTHISQFILEFQPPTIVPRNQRTAFNADPDGNPRVVRIFRLIHDPLAH
jgi:hypothetical protein